MRDFILYKLIAPISNSQKESFISKQYILFLFLLFAFNLQSKAQGNLLITPTRVVFEGNKQREEINLVNTGNDSAAYSISFIQYKMNEDGSFYMVDKLDSGQMSADPYLRIFPRRVVLAPREPQVIMLQFRRKADMLPGEYRSHLYFRSEKEVKPLGLDKTEQDSTQLVVQLIPIFGLSIPIIIRTGDVQVTSSISDIKLALKEDSLLSISFTIHRIGNKSIYGDLAIDFIPTKGKPFPIGSITGVGVYTTINKRFVNLKLDKIPATVIKSGKVRVQYINTENNLRSILAEGELVITE